MAIAGNITNSYKKEITLGTHTSTDTYKLALYTDTATLSNATAAYTATGEVANGNGYTTAGVTLTGFTSSLSANGSIAFVTFNDPTWATSSITARGGLIYNSSKSNKSVVVIDFGVNVTSTNDTFTVQFPNTSTTDTAVIEIS